MESTKCEKERLAQKCHDLEMQLNLMKEEKSNLSGIFSIPKGLSSSSPSHMVYVPCWGKTPKLLKFAPAFNLMADVRWTWPQLITLITGIALATAFTPSDFMHTDTCWAIRPDLT